MLFLKLSKLHQIYKQYGAKNAFKAILNKMRHKPTLNGIINFEYNEMNFNIFFNSSKIILFIINEMRASGGPIAALNAVEKAIEMNYNVVILSFTNGDLLKEYQKFNVPIIIFPEAKLNPYCFFEKIKFIPKLIFVNTIACAKFVSYSIENKINCIWWTHEGKRLFEIFNDVLPVAKLSNNIHVYNISKVAQDAFNQKYTYKKSKILPCGFSFSELHKNSRKKHKYKFLITGNSPYIKGLDILIKSLKFVEYSLKDSYEFNIVGEMSSANALKKIPKKYPIKVNSYKNIPHNKLLSIINDSDLVLIPSREETLSIVAIESMKYKTPFICSDTVGILSFLPKNIIQKITFQTDNPKSMANKINEFIKEPESFRLLNTDMHRIYLNYFSKTSFLENIEKIYKSILKND